MRYRRVPCPRLAGGKQPLKQRAHGTGARPSQTLLCKRAGARARAVQTWVGVRGPKARALLVLYPAAARPPCAPAAPAPAAARARRPSAARAAAVERRRPASVKRAPRSSSALATAPPRAAGPAAPACRIAASPVRRRRRPGCTRRRAPGAAPAAMDATGRVRAGRRWRFACHAGSALGRCCGRLWSAAPIPLRTRGITRPFAAPARGRPPPPARDHASVRWMLRRARPTRAPG